MRFFAVVALVSFGFAGLAWAKRLPPAEVPAVTDGTLRYEAPHHVDPCSQSGGCVVARDAVTGEQRWVVQLYVTVYDPFLERDVQDVYISSLTLTDGVLSVLDEKGRRFDISTTTRAVSRPSGQGCSSAPSSWWLLPALLWLARQRARRSSTRTFTN